jgi:hypothetical protein
MQSKKALKGRNLVGKMHCQESLLVKIRRNIRTVGILRDLMVRDYLVIVIEARKLM